MFYDNSQTDQYFSIIDKAKHRLPLNSSRKEAKELLKYAERHHVVPKSLGGTNDSTNLVWLTAEEHLHVHLLLPKMVKSEEHIRKMLLAATRMVNPQNKNHSRIIGDNFIPNINSIREDAAKAYSLFMKERNSGEGNPFYGKRHSAATKEKQRVASTNRIITKEMKINYSEGRKKFYQDQPDKKPMGDKNPRFNSTVFKWENIYTGENIDATRHDMVKKYPVLKSNISQVISGNYSHVKGWKLTASI